MEGKYWLVGPSLIQLEIQVKRWGTWLADSYFGAGVLRPRAAGDLKNNHSNCALSSERVPVIKQGGAAIF